MNVREYTGPSGGMRGDSPWLASEDIEHLEGGVDVQIDAVLEVQGAVFDAGRKEDVFALRFVGKKKLMVLNATNRKTLVDLFGVDTAGWKGKEITLWVNHNVRGKGGKTTKGLRIKRPSRAQQLGEQLDG